MNRGMKFRGSRRSEGVEGSDCNAKTLLRAGVNVVHRAPKALPCKRQVHGQAQVFRSDSDRATPADFCNVPADEPACRSRLDPRDLH